LGASPKTKGWLKKRGIPISGVTEGDRLLQGGHICEKWSGIWGRHWKKGVVKCLMRRWQEFTVAKELRSKEGLHQSAGWNTPGKKIRRGGLGGGKVWEGSGGGGG